MNTGLPFPCRRLRACLVTGLLLAALATAGGGAGAVEPRLGVDSRSLLGEPAGVALSGDELDRVTESLASRMRCPVCQGLSVADSPTDSALAMKSEVRELLAAGYAPAQVLDYFEGSYGEFIRLAPNTRGFNLMVWLAPIAALLLGAALIAARLRRRSAPSTSPTGRADSGPAAELDLADYLARVRREVGG